MTATSDIHLFGISNCDTVRKARKWCEANGVDATFVDFRRDGLELDKVEQWLQQVDWQLLLNKRGTTWRKLDKAEQDSVNQDTIAALLCREPTLIKRRVLEYQGAVYIGFSDEHYRDILLADQL